ncbi:uncharacterized protein AKAME5_002295000, partial [Lates japonicus]
ICMEFFRVTTKDLLGTFRSALDKYCPQLLKLYRARRRAFGQDMENFLDRLAGMRYSEKERKITNLSSFLGLTARGPASREL